MNVVDKHIPMRKKRIRKNACPWITNEIRNEIMFYMLLSVKIVAYYGIHIKV